MPCSCVGSESMPSHPSRAILLMGATATGKTELAAALVERFPLEIISVDSALIYRDMDIGTAKPDADLLTRAPHFLIDILDPAQSWSAWSFVEETRRLIGEISARGNLPLLVGGTMMYFHALQQGLNELPMADQAVRQQLLGEAAEQGLQGLYQRLRNVDPATADRLKPTDSQRILRALEVYQLSGRGLSELTRQAARAPDIEFDRIILDVSDRAQLHQRIAQRFNRMLEQGFEQEVMALRRRGDLDPGMPSMRCVGYRQMWQYLDGELAYHDMVERGIVATRQLAKRQLTWLRKYDDAARFDYHDCGIDDVVNALKLDALCS